ncbi:MAG: hypothetical protein M1837_002259 [Sclerophora amabilis]|nr:MAG: hypothetical protein M1837_002259 [Sclerophora amabilis]
MAAAPANNPPLAREESRTSLFAGHIGHLSQDQQVALEAFKQLCAEKGLYQPPVTGDPTSKASHDDGTLLRFLRARKFGIPEAFQQFSDTEAWREANKLDYLYNNIEIRDYEETRRLYPQWTGRRDRRGIPVYLYEVRSLDSKKMSAYHKSASKTSTPKTKSGSNNMQTPASPKLLRLFALYENLTRFVTPLCSRLPDRPCPEVPITQSSNLVDISGVGLSQFWNLRSHMQDASTLATAHYPETLDRIFIIGAPHFFPTVWGWIKKWFDPITTSKIFILSSSEVLPTLTKFIDPKNIPRKYGGELDYKFGMMPVLDSSAEESLGWSSGTAKAQEKQTTIPTGPLIWTEDEASQKILVAVGSVDGKERRDRIAVQRQAPG